MLICDYIVESIDGDSRPSAQDRSSRGRTEAGSKSASAI